MAKFGPATKHTPDTTVNRVEKLVNYLTFFYLTFPVIIFFVGWLSPSFSFPLSLLLVAGTYSYLKSITYQSINWCEVSRTNLLIVALIAFGWVYLSGIGGYSNQDWDHHFRNAVFKDLIEKEWPVYYQFPARYPIDFLAGHKAALNYYFTFWLPAALIGKIADQQTARAFLFCWAYIGIMLVFFQLFKLLNFKYILSVAIIFILWSGLDWMLLVTC